MSISHNPNNIKSENTDDEFNVVSDYEDSYIKQQITHTISSLPVIESKPDNITELASKNGTWKIIFKNANLPIHILDFLNANF